MVNASKFLSTEVFCTPVLFGGLARSTQLCRALSNQKRLSYLAKTKILTKRAYIEHKFYKKCKAAPVPSWARISFEVFRYSTYIGPI